MAKDKTSKTARVMNLLSKKQDTPPAEETAAAPASEAAPAPVPPLISSLTNDAEVSTQIKSALEDALAGELEGPAPAQEAAPAPAEEAPAPAPEPAPAPVAEETPAPAPAPAPVPVAETPAPAPAPVEEAPAPQVEPAPVQPAPVMPPPVAQTIVREAEEDRPGYINVMQVLVQEKAQKYVKMFGLCDCKRCLEDVEALALNHLPPKYVVMSENDRIPKLTFYEGQYSSDITAQLLQACKAVMETPHHKRDN